MPIIFSYLAPQSRVYRGMRPAQVAAYGAPTRVAYPIARRRGLRAAVDGGSAPRDYRSIGGKTADQILCSGGAGKIHRAVHHDGPT